MKKLVRIIAVIMMAAMLTATMLTATSCSDASKNANKAKNSIVRIANVATDETVINYGVGFFVGKGNRAEYVVTTADLGDNLYVVYDGIADIKSTDNKLDFVKDFPEENIALYRVKNKTTQRKVLKISESKKLKNLYDITVLSFQEEGSISAKSTIDRLVMTKGNISNVKAPVISLSTEIDFIQISPVINEKNVGGPLLNEKGVAVGMLIKSLGSEENYAVSLNALIKYLDSASIPYVGACLEWYWIVLIVIGGLIVLGAIALAILYFFVWKKPVEVDEDEEPEVDLAPNAVPSNFTITGVSGYFADNTFTVTDKITIGRDVQRCNIIFPPMTAGISSVHCEITRVGNHMEIVDKGSSCGTFLTNGVKLNINVPYVLTPGEIFYLGSQENQFLVG